ALVINTYRSSTYVICFIFFFLFFLILSFFFFFSFTDTPTTEIYTLSLHDALPICGPLLVWAKQTILASGGSGMVYRETTNPPVRSEEHTSELQSHLNLVCRLLLEKKKKKK